MSPCAIFQTAPVLPPQLALWHRAAVPHSAFFQPAPVITKFTAALFGLTQSDSVALSPSIARDGLKFWEFSISVSKILSSLPLWAIFQPCDFVYAWNCSLFTLYSKMHLSSFVWQTLIVFSFEELFPFPRASGVWPVYPDLRSRLPRFLSFLFGEP